MTPVLVNIFVINILHNKTSPLRISVQSAQEAGAKLASTRDRFERGNGDDGTVTLYSLHR